MHDTHRGGDEDRSTHRYRHFEQSLSTHTSLRYVPGLGLMNLALLGPRSGTPRDRPPSARDTDLRHTVLAGRPLASARSP